MSFNRIDLAPFEISPAQIGMDVYAKGADVGEREAASNQNILMNMLKAKYMAQEEPAKVALMRAQTKKFEQQAKSPLGGQPLTGTPAEAVSLEKVRQAFGENSPVYQNALKGYNTKVMLQDARGHYYNANYWLKNTTTIYKKQLEENYNRTNADRRSKGLPALSFPEYAQTAKLTHNITSPIDINTAANLAKNDRLQHPDLENSPGQVIQAPLTQRQNIQSELPPPSPSAVQQIAQQQKNYISEPDYDQRAKQFELSLIKDSTDPNTRKRILYSTNVDATMHRLNSYSGDALKYSSPQGLKQLVVDKKNSVGAHGYTSPQYQNYLNFNKALDLMKEQMIQFYDLSKEPSKSKEIRDMFETINFTSNPTQALNTLRNLESTYNQERNTFIKAIKDPTIYTKSRPDIALSLPKKISNGKKDLSGYSIVQLRRIGRGGK